ncbi:MAG: uroporphyrinogen-III C-methyltransferase [Elusimicrobia bacterium]|nr:uroporphyrinogen-III C-methyltransferase [Elusimicrobiota bacterium]
MGNAKATVYLVGAGPGRPDLITLRGVECLRQADAVVLDALVDRRVLSHCSPGVRIIEAGKRGGGRVFLRQPAINRLLVRLARSGKTVVRLKGGDPYFFGRGAEEAEALADQNIPFEVVPGVSSVTSVPGFAGIPLTHRGHASTVTVVTGHQGRENPYLGDSAGQAARRRGPGVDWAKISPNGTLVILMGLNQLPYISRRLLGLGWSPALPAAAIQWGSWAHQRTVRGTLSDIAWQVKQKALGAPAVIVIGDVAGLGTKLDWFGKRPLFGKTVLVTRAREQASTLTALLEKAGARVIESPLISISPLPLGKRGRGFLENLPQYDGILVTSANGAKILAKKIQSTGHLRPQGQNFFVQDSVDGSPVPIGEFRLAGRLKGRPIPPVFAVGAKTAEALRAEGLEVDRTAETFQSEGLVKLLGRRLDGKKFLLARARVGRDVIESALARRGARVDLWPLYETRSVALSGDAKAALLSGAVDAVTFTSSSTVTSFAGNFTRAQRRRLFSRARAVSIGPITSRALRARGIRPFKHGGPRPSRIWRTPLSGRSAKHNA